MKPLIIATTNRHKTKEIANLLIELADQWEIRDLAHHPEITPAPETGDTFEQNAALKAVSVSHKLKGKHILADDSGIEVDALGGEPGIYSARYSGNGGGDAENRTKLLKELEKFPTPGERTARFCCAMVLARDGEVITTVRGEIEGTVAGEESGSGGFGYDPIFIPEGHTRTFGELSPDIKNSISHRARALTKVAYYLRGHR